MGYSEENIKNTVKEKLQELSNSVKEAFKPDANPPSAMTEDAVNEKIAAAVAAAFTLFKTDAVITIKTQPVKAGAMVAGTIPVKGIGVLAEHTGSIT